MKMIEEYSEDISHNDNAFPKKQFSFKEYISLPAGIIFCFLPISLMIKAVCLISADFADFFNRYVASLFRGAFAYITALLPFSVAETAVLCILPFAAVYIVYLAVNKVTDHLVRRICSIASVAVFILCTFIICLSTGYDGASLEEKLGLDTDTVDGASLYYAAKYTAACMNKEVSLVESYPNGSSKMPYGFDEMIDKLNEAYDKLYDEYDFISPLKAPVKQIALSKPLTYTHFSGFYTPYTGEANVNINYPDYIIVYTAAHEMAHQRGISPEDEANFVAFLACAASDDSYIRYSGYVNMFEYLTSALQIADFGTEQSFAPIPISEKIIREFNAYSDMFEKYSDNVVADVSGAVNDVYLKANGVEEGEKSYGLVAELAAAYIKNLD